MSFLRFLQFGSAVLTVVATFLSVSVAKANSFADDWARARVESVTGSKTLTASTIFSEFKIGEVLVVQSQDEGRLIIGFVQVQSVQKASDGLYQLQLRLIRQSKYHFIQVGDNLYRMDFSTYHDEYKGTTELFLHSDRLDASARYKPLTYMSFTSGETAQTLQENEFLINALGYFDWGVTPEWEVGSVLLTDVLQAANFHTKYKFYDSDANIFSVGTSYTQSPDTKEGVVNMAFYWDSISSESVISHIAISIALDNIAKAKNFTALKSLAATSSIQTGYEFVLSNWDRVLAGPSYNFDTKSVGGYLDYVWIWDHTHFLLGLGTTNISDAIFNFETGYFVNVDLYWRF